MLRLVQSCWEYVDRTKFSEVGSARRGIYVLYQENSIQIKGRKKIRFDVVYVGMTDRSIRARLRSHHTKKKDWSHFSVYAVWPNITNEEIEELEGLFRHIYSKDSRANILNAQKQYKALASIKTKSKDQWLNATDFSRLGIKYHGY